MKKAIQALIVLFILRPIIEFDLWLRRRDCRPDEWHWADRLSARWGYLGGHVFWSANKIKHHVRRTRVKIEYKVRSYFNI